MEDVDYNSLMDDEQIIRIRQNPYSITNIKYPSERVRIETVKIDGMMIYLIAEQSKKVQLEVIKQNPHSLKMINRPTKETCLEAALKNVSAIFYVYKNLKILNYVINNLPSDILLELLEYHFLRLTEKNKIIELIKNKEKRNLIKLMIGI